MMIDIALNGSTEETIQDYQAMVMKGQEALKNTMRVR